VLDRLPTVGRLLRLRARFGDGRLEAACQRALAYGDPAYPTVKRILTEGLDAEPQVPSCATPVSTARAIVREVADLVGSALGGLSWN
jgi:hypothetical protein